MSESQNTNLNRRVQNFAASLDRWIDEADLSCVPPYIRALISTPARDLQTSSCPIHVSIMSPLLSVLEMLQDSRTVVVQEDGNEFQKEAHTVRILSRLVFLEHSLTASSLSDPLSSLVDGIPALGCIHAHETLDVALRRMLETGFDEVGVLDAGIVTSVLHIDDIYKFLSKELALLGFSTPSKLDVFEGRDETEEHSLLAETSADLKQRIDSQKHLRGMSALQVSAQQFCKGYWTEFLIVFCILLDVCCSIYVYETATNDDDDLPEQKLQVATGIILFVFLYEAVVRVYGFRSALLRLPFELVDLAIVAISVTIYCLVLEDAAPPNSKFMVTLTRIIRGLRMFKLVKLIASAVIKQSMLYHRDGFALDISFVTRSCIAMSLPEVGSQANFANPIEEVCRFFNTKFPDRYLIFDLCSKPAYGDEHFGGRVERIPVEKHNPPRLGQMAALVERAAELMEEDPKACIAVHCKSGRDRTGVMVCAWLMYTGFADSADDAMQWFAARRLRSQARAEEGVSMASQRRYVRYFETALRQGGFYAKRRVLLRRVVVRTCPAMDAKRGCSLWLAVDEDGREVYRSWFGLPDQDVGVVHMSQGDAEVGFELGLPVAGDVRLTFYHKEPTAGRDQLCFFLCVHTGFATGSQVEEFTKEAVDMAASDGKCKVFRKDFAVRLEFDHPAPGGGMDPVTSAAETAAAAGERAGPSRGPYRKIRQPAARLSEAAVRMRGRDLDVQRRSAMRLRRMVLRGLEVRRGGAGGGGGGGGKVGSGPGRGGDEEASLNRPGETVEGSLCCAAGPAVQHESVDLFRSDDSAGAASMTGARHSSQTLSASNYFAHTLGARIARSLVSGNKRRFVEDGFDLDLSYITARVIAMGFPSSGIESSYRNAKEEVYRFFQERHAAHYRIVNLCSERAYSLDTFHGNCVRYPFPDHNPPALELILPCCAHIHKFLQADPDNVVAIHCKAGKGRTGLIVVCYLMYCGFRHSATEARSFYDWARTTDGKGLTITSQIRYAHYFESQLRALKGGIELPTAQDRAPAMILHRFRLHTVPRFNSDAGCDFSWTISVKSEIDHKEYIVSASSDGGTKLVTDASGERPASAASVQPFYCTPAALAGLALKAHAIDLTASESRDGSSNNKGSPDVGTRVAGDFTVTFRDGEKGKIMFFFVLHSALLTAPPGDMGGRARQLSPEECTAAALPTGVWSLVLHKHEIDGAAKDTRCAHFDQDFRVEIFFSELLGQAGTGPALDTARTEAVQQQSNRSDGPPVGAGASLTAEALAVGGPLRRDREEYNVAAAAIAAAGNFPVPSFEQWLLGKVPGSIPSVPPAASLRSNAATRPSLAASAGGLSRSIVREGSIRSASSGASGRAAVSHISSRDSPSSRSTGGKSAGEGDGGRTASLLRVPPDGAAARAQAPQRNGSFARALNVGECRDTAAGRGLRHSGGVAVTLADASSLGPAGGLIRDQDNSSTSTHPPDGSTALPGSSVSPGVGVTADPSLAVSGEVQLV